MAVGQINLIATDYAGTTSEIAMTGALNQHITVEFVPGVGTEEMPDIETLTLTDANAAIVDVTVLFERTCVPENPFYVRWINRLGGWEYQMFDQHKMFEGEASDLSDFHPFIENTQTMYRSREILGMEAKQVVTVGLEQLPRDEFDRLAELMYSPRIDVYDPDLQNWFGITLDGNASVEWDTHGALGAIEYQFRLKDTQIQF